MKYIFQVEEQSSLEYLLHQLEYMLGNMFFRWKTKTAVSSRIFCMNSEILAFFFFQVKAYRDAAGPRVLRQLTESVQSGLETGKFPQEAKEANEALIESFKVSVPTFRAWKGPTWRPKPTAYFRRLRQIDRFQCTTPPVVRVSGEVLDVAPYSY